MSVGEPTRHADFGGQTLEILVEVTGLNENTIDTPLTLEIVVNTTDGTALGEYIACLTRIIYVYVAISRTVKILYILLYLHIINVNS